MIKSIATAALLALSATSAFAGNCDARRPNPAADDEIVKVVLPKGPSEPTGFTGPGHILAWIPQESMRAGGTAVKTGWCKDNTIKDADSFAALYAVEFKDGVALLPVDAPAKGFHLRVDLRLSSGLKQFEHFVGGNVSEVQVRVQ